jgi:hypothetical protein
MIKNLERAGAKVHPIGVPLTLQAIDGRMDLAAIRQRRQDETREKWYKYYTDHLQKVKEREEEWTKKLQVDVWEAVEQVLVEQVLGTPASWMPVKMETRENN